MEFVRGGTLHWARDFVSHEPEKMKDALCQQMCAFRREMKEAKEPGWQKTKLLISGKGYGQQDDLVMALQMALYWGLHTLSDTAFQAARTRNGWF